MEHPGKLLQQELTMRWFTQKVFSTMIGKKVSEVNELIKGKRNITVQRDILLSIVFGDPEQKWIRLQNDYDYSIAKPMMQQKIQDILSKKIQAPIISSIPATPPTQQEKTKEHEVFDDF